jgi:O-succinylbenzoate synthase
VGHRAVSWLSIERRTLHFTRPVRSGSFTLERREAAWIAVTAVDGSNGTGVAAPLPGLHRESLDEAIAAIEGRRSAIEALDPAAAEGLPPSAAFATGVAIGVARRDPLLVAPLAARLPLNALFAGDAAGARAAGESGSFRGFRSVKVKIDGDPARDRAVVEALLATLAPTQRLRLDANRRLSLEAALALVRGLPPERIEYLEEPLSDPLLLPRLHHETGLSIALDESLHEPSLRAALETAPGVAVHVLKPSLVGSVAAVRARAERTARQGLETVLSSAYDPRDSLRRIAIIATRLPAATRDHGLATGDLHIDDRGSRLEILEGEMTMPPG